MITSINPTSQTFKGVDFKSVTVFDRNDFIKGNMQQLNELGKNYDIELTSCYTKDPNTRAIDIMVRPLKDKLSFFQRLFRPIGRSSFETELFIVSSIKSRAEFIDAIHRAIADLSKKVRLHK